MKLATVDAGDGPKLAAVVSDGTFVDLAGAAVEARVDPSAFASMQALIDAGDAGLADARLLLANKAPLITFSPDTKLLAPLPLPVQIRDCLTFETHLKNAFESAMKLAAAREPDPVAAEIAMRASGRYVVPDVWYRQPIYYKANRFAVSAPDAEIVWPDYSTVMDYELEIACVIGKGGRDIAAINAETHIFGYTIFNDFSARDAQGIEQMGMLGPAKGKDFDGANAFGPLIVTRDEITNPYALKMRARVNGDLWSDGSTADMHWRFPALIEHISRAETLHPGEIIGSGTVGGGCGLEQLRFLADGDLVELEIDGIGTLRNRVRVSDAKRRAAANSIA